MKKIKVICDWTGTLAPKQDAAARQAEQARIDDPDTTKFGRALAPGATDFLFALVDTNCEETGRWAQFCNADVSLEILSIANDVTLAEREKEIKDAINQGVMLGDHGMLEDARMISSFDVKVIKPPKTPEMFQDAEADLVVVFGDRPCREIQAGNKAGAFTVLIRDKGVSECTKEPLVGEFEGEPYDGVPNMTFYSLEDATKWLKNTDDVWWRTDRREVLNFRTMQFAMNKLMPQFGICGGDMNLFSAIDAGSASFPSSMTESYFNVVQSYLEHWSRGDMDMEEFLARSFDTRDRTLLLGNARDCFLETMLLPNLRENDFVGDEVAQDLHLPAVVLLLEHQLFTKELTPAGEFAANEIGTTDDILANGLQALWGHIRKEEESSKDSQEGDD